MTDRHPTSAGIELVGQVITSCRSVRVFPPAPVARKDIETILDVACRAPPGSSIQPWRVYVLMDKSKACSSEPVLVVYVHSKVGMVHREGYPYYPRTWINLYQNRCRKVGRDLYSLLGIEHAGEERMHAQYVCNPRFLDTSVGITLTINRVMEQGSWFDYDMFPEAATMVARTRGTDTCPQAAFMQFRRIVAEQLGLMDDEMAVRGMSMGHTNRAVIENAFVIEHTPVSEFTRFLD